MQGPFKFIPKHPENKPRDILFWQDFWYSQDETKSDKDREPSRCRPKHLSATLHIEKKDQRSKQAARRKAAQEIVVDVPWSMPMESTYHAAQRDWKQDATSIQVSLTTKGSFDNIGNCEETALGIIVYTIDYDSSLTQEYGYYMEIYPLVWGGPIVTRRQSDLIGVMMNWYSIYYSRNRWLGRATSMINNI